MKTILNFKIETFNFFMGCMMCMCMRMQKDYALKC